MPRCLAVLTLGLVLGACGSAPVDNVLRFEAAEREPAPSLDAPPLTDEPPVASLEPGTPAVVAFWGSWCGPCRAEQPHLNEVYERFGDEVTFVGVNTRNDQRAAALAFLDEFDVPYGSIYDPDSVVASAFGVRVMPATFVVDAEGRLAAQIIGGIRSPEQLAGILEEVIA